jgi:hypothetical protein
VVIPAAAGDSDRRCRPPLLAGLTDLSKGLDGSHGLSASNRKARLGIAAIALIQVAYWIGYRIRPTQPRFVNVVLGHILIFVSELIFVFAAVIFAYLFISKSLENQISIPSYVVILFGLFSLFCYFLELKRFGRCLLGHKEDDEKHGCE